MPTHADLILYGLIATDVVLYLLLIEGYLRNRRWHTIPKVSTPEAAFAFLEKSYKERFHEVPDGFTWGEAIFKARTHSHLTDYEWGEVQKSLRQYEAYRYGSVKSEVDVYPILKLAVSLQEKAAVAI